MLKTSPNNWFDLILAVFIGIGICFFGIGAVIDRFSFGIDLSNYHTIIGIGSIAFGALYLYLVARNYSKEE